MRPIIIDGSVLTVPLQEEAQAAMEAFLRSQSEGLDAALAPFGLSADDVMMPKFERLVYPEEEGFSPSPNRREA